jgi:hypothetical protein
MMNNPIRDHIIIIVSTNLSDCKALAATSLKSVPSGAVIAMSVTSPRKKTAPTGCFRTIRKNKVV